MHDKSVPEGVDEVAVFGDLECRGEECYYPRDYVALGHYELSFEVLGHFWHKYVENSVKLVHFDFEHGKLVGE